LNRHDADVLTVGPDQPDFLDPNPFIDPVFLGADKTLSFLVLLKPPGEPAPGGYRPKS
jgi:hypothetical protein